MRHKTDYRPDIDGLRAIAVLAVVLFHLDIEVFSGGFVGVDVFFVISGFLISSIIAAKAEAGRFSFRDFYLGRVRRIIPPLVATVAATFIASAFILTPDDFQRFARSAVAALASVSNIVFYLEAGYWDTASELKPLLHTWSLGVEEQFYLVWPAVIVGTLALAGRARLPAILAGIAVLGFLATLIYGWRDLSGAFYLFPFRVFQFAAGAALGCLVRLEAWPRRNPPGWARDGVLLAGLVSVLASILLFDGETAFPGGAVLLPTLGAVALLLSGSFTNRQAGLGRAMLENPVSVWLGKISYALYLVHWPVVALYRYRTGLDLTPVEQLALAAAMLVAAAGLHYGLERRFYRRAGQAAATFRLTPGAFALRTVAVSLVFALVAGHAWFAGGWAWRIPDLSLTAEQIEAGQSARFSRHDEVCPIEAFYSGNPLCNRPDTRRILFLGNSHEPDAYNFLLGGFGDQPGLEFIRFGTTNPCGRIEIAPDGRLVSDRPACADRLEVLNRDDFLASLDDLVYAVRGPFWSNKRGFVDLLAWLKARNPDLRIIVMGGYFSTDIPCARIVNETGDPRNCAAPEHVTGFEGHPQEEPLYGEVMALADMYIDRVALLCEERRAETCLTRTPEGVPVFYDEHHMSLEFAEMAGRMYAGQNPDLFGPPPTAAPGTVTVPGGGR